MREVAKGGAWVCGFDPLGPLRKEIVLVVRLQGCCLRREWLKVAVEHLGDDGLVLILQFFLHLFLALQVAPMPVEPSFVRQKGRPRVGPSLVMGEVLGVKMAERKGLTFKSSFPTPPHPRKFGEPIR